MNVSVVVRLILHSSVHFTVSLFFGGYLALIVKLFTSAKPNLYLDVLAREVKGQGNQSKALLAHQAPKLHKLTLMHKQLALTERLTIEDISFFIRTYVHTDNEKGANELADLIEMKTGVRPEIEIMGPVIGSHVGPGSVSCGWLSVKTREQLHKELYS